MTTQEINIAIAETQGYEWTETSTIQSGYTSWADYADKCGAESLDEFPNYCRDLNAMHAVWCTLTARQHQQFRRELQMIVADAIDNDSPKDGPVHSVCNATAIQRAEAYLRTVGKWKE